MIHDPNWVLLDTNVVCRHALQDHENHSPRATAMFLEVAQGTTHIFCPATVVFEAVYVMTELNDSPRSDVLEYFKLVSAFPGFHLEHASSVINALDLWCRNAPLDFADCFHLALAHDLEFSKVYTFDKKMNRFPGVERIEP